MVFNLHPDIKIKCKVYLTSTKNMNILPSSVAVLCCVSLPEHKVHFVPLHQKEGIQDSAPLQYKCVLVTRHASKGLFWDK